MLELLIVIGRGLAVAVRPLVQIPIGLQPHPQVRRCLQESCEPKRCVRGDAALAENDFI
jgi:hypothetical protein